MARLASQEKGLFYPTPLSIVRRIAGLLELAAPEEEPAKGLLYRLMDPSAGDGKALQQLQQSLQSVAPNGSTFQTWGVEVSPQRAAEAKARLDVVLEAPFEVASYRPRLKPAVSVLFQNPPYDWEYGGDRLEREFLLGGTSWQVTGSVLVYLIPATAANWSVLAEVYREYRDVVVYRFPTAEEAAVYPDVVADGKAALFSTYKQLIIIGRKLSKRRPSLTSLYSEVDAMVDAVNDLVRNGAGSSKARVILPITDPDAFGTRRWRVPPLTADEQQRARLFRSGYSEEELLAALVSGEHSKGYRRMVDLLNPPAALMAQPLQPLNVGHLAGVIASGVTGDIEAVIDGETVLFKGRAVKESEKVKDTKGEEVWRDKLVTHLVTVGKSGVTDVSDPEAVKKALRQNIGAIHDVLKKRLPPYGIVPPTPQQAALLNTLSTDKVIPGLSQAGLLDKQKEAALALAQSIKRYHVGHLVAEMGFGKTRTALAVAALTNAWPALIIAPPHLVDKWQAEAEAAVPNARAVIVESITQLQEVIADYEANDRAAEKAGERLVVIMARSRIKMGPGWGPAYLRKRAKYDAIATDYQAYQDTRQEMFTARKDGRYADAALHRQKLRTLRLHMIGQATIAAHNEVLCPDCFSSITEQVLNGSSEKIAKQYLSDPQGYLSKHIVKCEHKVAKRKWDGETTAWESRTCNAKLLDYGKGKFRRWPLADYIRKKASRFFGILIADEVHQYKAKESDQGWAFQILVNVIPRTLTLTGTFFGGTASSIFYLLYRTQPNIRDDFAFTEVRKWSQLYGILEQRYRKAQVSEEDGALNGRKRIKVSTREKPGINPAVLKYMLPTTYFARLEDLGVALPAYGEAAEDVQMDDTFERQYRKIASRAWMTMLDNRPYWTANWFQLVLGWPNAAFRENTYVLPNGQDWVIPPVVTTAGVLPKERTLLDVVKDNISRGRKTIVYVRQTNTRDIRGRLRDLLVAEGVDTVVLKSTIPTRRRERWLKDHVGDVLITNPKLVETGLDLVQYSTVLFYEIEYSLYTLWQAVRRVWRIGQVNPVEVYYLLYDGAIEKMGFGLVQKKLEAASLVYGDDVSSAIVNTGGDNSLVYELIDAIKAKRVVTPTTATLFGGQVIPTTGRVLPTGQPALPGAAPAATAQAQPVQRLTLEEFIALAKAKALRERAKARRKKKAQPTAGASQQLGFGF